MGIPAVPLARAPPIIHKVTYYIKIQLYRLPIVESKAFCAFIAAAVVKGGHFQFAIIGEKTRIRPLFY